jgi:hypothetical protein
MSAILFFAEHDFEILDNENHGFKVNKQLLSQKCPYFETLFQCSELSSSVTLPFSTSTLGAALEFCYFNRFSMIANVFELYQCASYLQLPALMNLISTDFSNIQCDESNVEQWISLAKCHGDTKLFRSIVTRFPKQLHEFKVDDWIACEDEVGDISLARIKSLSSLECEVHFGGWSAKFDKRVSIFDVIAIDIIPYEVQNAQHNLIIMATGEFFRVQMIGQVVENDGKQWVIFRKFNCKRQLPQVGEFGNLRVCVLKGKWFQSNLMQRQLSRPDPNRPAK